MRKMLLAVSAAGIIGAASVIGVGVASAQTSSTNDNTLVDKIATTFNINKADVQKVFDQNRTEHEAEHATELKTKLDQAVKDDKLTQAQEDALIAKLNELRTAHEANRDAMADKTEAERRAAMQAERDSFKQWLTDNKIPEEYARLGMGGRGHHGFGGPGGPDSSQQTDSSSGTSTTN